MGERRVKRQQRAMLGCVASHPGKCESERAGNFLQTRCENTRNQKLLRKTLNAMLVRLPPPDPLSGVLSSSSVSASGPVPQLAARSSQLSVLSSPAPLCLFVCLPVWFILPFACLSLSLSRSLSRSLGLSLHLHLHLLPVSVSV